MHDYLHYPLTNAALRKFQLLANARKNGKAKRGTRQVDPQIEKAGKDPRLGGVGQVLQPLLNGSNHQDQNQQAQRRQPHAPRKEIFP